MIDDYSSIPIDELILNEDSIEWDKFSASKKHLSLAEVRLFRSKIKWNIFFIKGGVLDHNQLNVASKYFTSTTYQLLSNMHWVSQQFISEFKDRFNWEKLIRTVYLTPATILSSLDIIKEQIPNSSDLKSAFESALFFRITDPEYEEIKLYVDVNSSI